LWLQRLSGGALNNYGAVTRACQPYRAKTKGKAERPFRYIRQDFFLARTFLNMHDLNAQFDAWRTEVAKLAKYWGESQCRPRNLKAN